MVERDKTDAERPVQEAGWINTREGQARVI